MEYGKYKLNKIDWLEFKRYNLYLLNQKLTIKITVFWASIIILSLYSQQDIVQGDSKC